MTQNHACLTPIAPDVWQAADDGRILLTITGAPPAILGPATASLVADHHFPPGQWHQHGPDRYDYLPGPSD